MILRTKTRGGTAARSFTLVHRTLGKRNQECEEEIKTNWRERKEERQEKGEVKDRKRVR